MKIITDNCIYVQKSDLDALGTYPIPMPLSIYLKYFKDGINLCEGNSVYSFVKFEDKNEIDFFKKLDWMVDYKEFSQLSDEELMELGKKLSRQSRELASLYESMSDDEKLNNRTLFIKHELLEYKIHSIAEIIWIKLRLIRITMPEGVEVFDKKVNCEKERGPKKFIKKFIKHIS